MKGNYRFVFIFSLLSVVTGASAQRIDSLLEVYDAKVPQEKAYVHFDNTLYVPGQTVWYKAYLLRGIEPSGISKNFYIDWFDNKGKLLKRVIAPIVSSTAAGSFTIPEKYTGDHIQVLAYTKWMLNFDSSLLFHHTLSVAQPAATTADGPAVMPVTTLRFFPEGGDMVEGLQSTIAFKAAVSGGSPYAVDGVINNSKGEAITNFQATHNGMGKFTIFPVAGEVYTAAWKDAQGATHYTRLPPVKPRGIALAMGQRNGRWFFSIERAENAEAFKKVMIVATMQQQIVFQANVNLSAKAHVSAAIPSDKFISGVLQVTVMDSDKHPLAERIVFVNNHEYLAPAKITTDTLSLDKRGKNIFEIDWADTTNTSLSLAITDGLYDSSVNIISGLLLSSEIKGYVHDPAYYFSSDADSVAHQLDLVMMTNGWRRFAWDDVLAGSAPALLFGRDSGYLSIAGKIDKLSEARVKKAEQVNMVLVARDSSKQLIFTPLLPDGSFRQDNLVLFDTVKIYYQLNKSYIPARSNVAIKNSFLEYDSARRLAAIGNYLPDTTGRMRLLSLAAEQRRLDSLMLRTTLKEVVVKARIKTKLEEMDDRYASGFFKSSQSRSFNMADDKWALSTQSVFTYLQSRVAGLIIQNAFSSTPTAIRRGGPVAYFLNEMSVDNATLAAISPASIAYVKVLDPPFFGAAGGGQGGAIAVYTKKGDEAIQEVKGMDYTLLAGYTPVKEFYSPDPGETKGSFPRADLRRTLYWNPNIALDGANKKARITFYNNDISHSLQLVLEGVTDDGRVIHYRSRISQIN